MIQRGRKSLASSQVQTIGIGATNRLQPPALLTDAQRDVWLQTVNDQPAEAFSDVHIPLLEMYCRHVVQARVIAEQLLSFDPEWLSDDDGLRRYDKLLAMQEREGRAASSLATRLRITRQAIHADVASVQAKRHTKAKKPWQLAEEIEN